MKHRELLQERTPEPGCDTDAGARNRALELIHGECDTPFLFVKDMAYYLRQKYFDLFLTGATNTFIIRNPEETLLSHYKKCPTFTLEEAGYESLDRLHSYVTEELGQKSIIVDGNDFRRDPQGILKKYTEAVGMPFCDDVCEWELGELQKWNLWSAGGWHDEVANTDRVLAPSDVEPDLSEVPPRVLNMIPPCREIYEKLFDKRIRPNISTQNGTAQNPPQS